jgi:hypothetical protein
MVGSDLSAAETTDTIPVVLDGGEEPSGLAEILHQFLEQTLAASPRKVGQARRLSGAAVFRSTEDEDVAVRIRFAGDRIELRDGGSPDPRDPMITADFLTIAHLTSGQGNPFRLLAQRKLRARFSLVDVPFLLGVLRLMRTRPATQREERPSPLGWLWPLALAAVIGGALYWRFAGAP